MSVIPTTLGTVATGVVGHAPNEMETTESVFVRPPADGSWLVTQSLGCAGGVSCVFNLRLFAAARLLASVKVICKNDGTFTRSVWVVVCGVQGAGNRLSMPAR